MRLCVTLTMVTGWVSSALAQPEVQLIPKVDQRIELMNIIDQLARYGEANDSINHYYATEVNNHFKRFANHAAIEYAREQIAELEKGEVHLSDWEIPSLAVHLTGPPELNPLVPKNTDQTDGWDDRTLMNEKFIALIRSFYVDSDASSFFERQAAYYERISEVYLRSGTAIDTKWVNDFFGTAPTETYFPIMSLSNNSRAYIRVNIQNNHRNTHTIFGCDSYTEAGIPTCFQDPYFSWAMLHEYIHCFSNQLIELDTVTFRKIGKKLLAIPGVDEKVKDTFYGNWRYLLYESLVRAVSILYCTDKEKSSCNRADRIQKEVALGFLWMDDLVNELELYGKNRNKYKTLGTYKKQLILTFEHYTRKRKS